MIMAKALCFLYYIAQQRHQCYYSIVFVLQSLVGCSTGPCVPLYNLRLECALQVFSMQYYHLKKSEV